MNRYEPSDGEAVPPQRGIWEAIADALIGDRMAIPPLIDWSGIGCDPVDEIEDRFACYDPVDEAEQILADNEPF